jgi:hypothetical protein
MPRFLRRGSPRGTVTLPAKNRCKVHAGDAGRVTGGLGAEFRARCVRRRTDGPAPTERYGGGSWDARSGADEVIE